MRVERAVMRKQVPLGLRLNLEKKKLRDNQLKYLNNKLNK